MVVHVVYPSHAISLNNEVPDKKWFGKNDKYDHLRVL